jgi:hypothetical protein
MGLKLVMLSTSFVRGAAVVVTAVTAAAVERLPALVLIVRRREEMGEAVVAEVLDNIPEVHG